MVASRNQHSFFPNTTVAGAYFPLSNVITLDAVDSALYLRSVRGLDIAESLKVQPLIFHELRHWFDHIGTVWGQRTLVEGCEAMAARRSNNPEEFWRILKFRRNYNSALLSEYYTTVENRRSAISLDDRWRAGWSCGLRFDQFGKPNPANPVLFMKFDWPDGKHACRVPVSILSLLESGAMYFECATRLGLIAGMAPGEREVEAADWNRELLNQLYNPDLAVYSVAAHIVANRLKASDAYIVYQLTAALASVCLNLTVEMHNKLRIPAAFEAFSDRAKALIKNEDKGFAFASLALHGPQNVGSEFDFIEWIEEALRASGLPSLDVIQNAASDELDQISKNADAGLYQEYLLGRLRTGRTFFEKFGVMPEFNKVLNDKSPAFPPILLNDWVRAAGERIEEVQGTSLDHWIDECNALDRAMETFTGVCGT